MKFFNYCYSFVDLYNNEIQQIIITFAHVMMKINLRICDNFFTLPIPNSLKMALTFNVLIDEWNFSTQLKLFLFLQWIYIIFDIAKMFYISIIFQLKKKIMLLQTWYSIFQNLLSVKSILSSLQSLTLWFSSVINDCSIKTDLIWVIMNALKTQVLYVIP